MIIKSPKTIEDFENVKNTILELMNNPYSDYNMFLNLSKRLRDINSEIDKLKEV